MRTEQFNETNKEIERKIIPSPVEYSLSFESCVVQNLKSVLTSRRTPNVKKRIIFSRNSHVNPERRKRRDIRFRIDDIERDKMTKQLRRASWSSDRKFR